MKFVLGAVGGNAEVRKKKAALAAHVTHLESCAVDVADFPPWDDQVSTVRCLIQSDCSLIQREKHDNFVCDFFYLCGHVHTQEFASMCSKLTQSWALNGEESQNLVCVQGPGFNYGDNVINTDRSLQLWVNDEEVPTYSRIHWQQLLNSMPIVLRRLRKKILTESFLSRDIKTIKVKENRRSDSFIRWAGLPEINHWVFEEAVASLLVKEAPSLLPALQAAKESKEYLHAACLIWRAHAKVLRRCPQKVAGALDAIINECAPFGGYKEHDAWALHLMLRKLAGKSTRLDHSFHLEIIKAVISGRAYQFREYLTSLRRPNSTCAIWHNLGTDPNLNDYLAIKLAEAVQNTEERSPKVVYIT